MKKRKNTEGEIQIEKKKGMEGRRERERAEWGGRRRGGHKGKEGNSEGEGKVRKCD